MRHQLSITTSRGPGQARIIATGEIDIATTAELHRAITAVLSTTTPPATVLVDLGRVDFLDCAGVTTLLAGLSLANARGATFHTVGAHGVAGRILQLLALDALLTDGSAPARPDDPAGSAATDGRSTPSAVLVRERGRRRALAAPERGRRRVYMNGSAPFSRLVVYDAEAGHDPGS